MATIESAIYARLSGFAALSALVAARIYPSEAPSNPTAPYVVFRRVSDFRPAAMGSDTGIVRARFQIDSVAEAASGASAYSTALAVRQAAMDALKRYRAPAGDPVIQDVFLLLTADLYDADTRRHVLIADFEVNYVEV
jgi:hypothetical protein